MAESALEISHVDVKFNNGIVRHVTNDATGENLYLVGVFDNSVGTLVHECAHAAFYVCDDVGVRVETRQRNETFCYLLDRMFSHFHQYIPQKEIK